MPTTAICPAWFSPTLKNTSAHDCCKGIGLVVSNGGKIHDYEGVDKSMISIADSEDVETIFREIEEVETDNIYLITWIKTFYHMKKYIEKEGN